MGFLYRIFLSRFLGAEGIGIYQIALSVFGVLITITASGIPITVSRMIIKHKSQNDEKGASQTLSAGILTAILISAPITILFFVFKNKLGFLFSDKRCVSVLAIIMPTLIINSIYAVLRGSFWGNKNFFIYSLIEFLEEFIMLCAGIMLIYNAKGIMDGVKKASWAVFISYVFSFVFSFGVIIYKKTKPTNPFTQLKPLFSSAIPVTAMRTTSSLISSLVAIILPARLIKYGLSSSGAIAHFGEVSGMAIPMLFIPSSLIGSIALVLVPELSENYYKKNYKTLSSNIVKALKYSIFIACMIIPIFASCGVLIGKVVYHNQNAGKYLVYSSLMMLPLSVSLITTSMLNSLNCEKKTLLYYFIGEAGLIVCIYFLPKFLGAGSLIAGYYFSFSLSSVLNLLLLKKKCTQKLKYLKFTFLSLLFTALSTTLGILLKNILLRYTGEIACLAVVGLVVCVFNILLYTLIDFINVKVIFKIGNGHKRNTQYNAGDKIYQSGR